MLGNEYAASSGVGGIGKKLAMLQQPKPPKKIAQAVEFGKVLFDVLKAKPGRDFFPACQQVVIQGDELDLNKLPLIRPYPGDAGKIITLGLVITRDCETGTPNVGVYRLQLQSKNTMTVHWLSVRGGARHLRKAAERGKKLEIAIALGVDPNYYGSRNTNTRGFIRMVVCRALWWFRRAVGKV